MSLPRRSFLGLLAGAAASAAAPPLPELLRGGAAPNPVLPDWWRRYTIWDQVKTADFPDSMFFPPLPGSFYIDSVSWSVPADVCARDFEQLLERVKVRILADDYVFLEGSLLSFSPVSPGLGATAVMVPNLAPSRDFRVELAGDPQLSRVVPVRFFLDGSVKVEL